MSWMFISGLLVAFIGAFFAHLFVTYRKEKERFRQLIAILSQFAELDKEDIREAGQAMREAQSRGTKPTELAHTGNNIWRLRERMHEAAEPVWHELSTECKNSIDLIDEWLVKLNKGPALAHMNHQWVTGEAGNAIDELPSFNFLTFIIHYFTPSKPSYPDTMELKREQQAEIKTALETRREKLNEMGSYDDSENKEDRNKDTMGARES